MKKTELKELANVSFNVIARMGKNKTVSIDTIEKICLALDCKIEDIFLFSGN